MVSVLWLLQYRTALYKIDLWSDKRVQTLDANPAFSASTRHCLVKSFRFWWHVEVPMLKARNRWYCIETSHRNIYFLYFRRQNPSSETVLKLLWKISCWLHVHTTCPVNESIPKLQMLFDWFCFCLGEQRNPAALQSFNGTNLQLR